MPETASSSDALMQGDTQNLVHECPCCEYLFKDFRTSGKNAKHYDRCPNCGSLGRHRQTWLFLKTRTNLFSQQLTLLHFAPEAPFTRAFRSMSHLTYLPVGLRPGKSFRKLAAETSPSTVPFNRLSYTNMDITAIPIKDNSIDVVLCNHVLEHIPDDRRAIRELYRVMKPGGWGLLQVPMNLQLKQTYEDPTIVSPEDRAREFNNENHVRLYGRDYTDRLTEAGFVVTLEDFGKELGQETCKKYGFSSRNLVCLSVKL